jgi:hypothetical protein
MAKKKRRKRRSVKPFQGLPGESEETHDSSKKPVPAGAAEQPRWRRIVSVIGISTLVLIILLILLELAIRVLGIGPIRYIQPETARAYRLNEPGTTMKYSGWLPYLRREFVTTLTFNSLGFRDREYPRQKPARTFRIVVLGDSYVEAKEVELKESFHKRLELLLNSGKAPVRFEVIAFGKGGTTIPDYMLMYREYAGLYHPDLVVLCFFPGNDVMEISPLLSHRFSQWAQTVYFEKVIPAKQAFIDRWLWIRGSRLNQLLVDRLMGVYIGNLHRFDEQLDKPDLIAPSINVYSREYDTDWSEAWQLVRRHINEFSRYLSSREIPLLVMIVNSFQNLGITEGQAARVRNFDLQKPALEMQRICREEHVDCLDVTPAMKRLRESGQTISWPQDGHWTPAGHAAAADTLYRYLEPRLSKGRYQEH